MTELLSMLGRLHPLVVHLPIGAVVLLAFLELLARYPHSKNSNASAGWILAFAVPSLIAAAVCGWVLAGAGDYGQDILRWHRWTGLGAAAAGVAAGLAYRLEIKKLYRLALAVTLALIIGAGHFGGALTHGSDYLAVPLLSHRGPKKTGYSATGSGFVAEAKPVLDRYCVGCHGPEKAKGELRLDSLAALLKGGDSGPALVPGDVGGSLLMKRVMAPLDADGHMPPEGKPQPSSAEVAQLRRGLEAVVRQ